MLCKICSHCGKRYTGKTCNCYTVNKMNKERQNKYDKDKRHKQAAEFYNSPAWRKLRKLIWARALGLDEYLYYTTGQIVKANTVHHIEPLLETPSRAFDASNLICVSNSTHSLLHDLYDSGKKESTQKVLYNAVGCLQIK